MQQQPRQAGVEDEAGAAVAVNNNIDESNSSNLNPNPVSNLGLGFNSSNAPTDSFITDLNDVHMSLVHFLVDSAWIETEVTQWIMSGGLESTDASGSGEREMSEEEREVQSKEYAEAVQKAITEVKILVKVGAGSDSCSICLDDFASAAPSTTTSSACVAHLGCKHSFHKACIQQWLARKNSCPLCKRKVIDMAADPPQVKQY